jgi:large-conductance mechanosensitive channel
MQKLREILADGGIVLLAVIFALAAATISLADAVSREVVSILVQSTGDEQFGDSPFTFTVGDTRIDLTYVFQEAIVVALVVLALFAAWRLTKRARRTCAECLSVIPAEGTICRYCTSENRELDTA